jgi:hypothetical protein
MTCTTQQVFAFTIWAHGLICGWSRAVSSPSVKPPGCRSPLVCTSLLLEPECHSMWAREGVEVSWACTFCTRLWGLVAWNLAGRQGSVPTATNTRLLRAFTY